MPRSPILLCILLLTIPTAHSLEATVTLLQGGSTKESFDVGGAIVYSIEIPNDIGSSMRYTVELTVGPDNEDYSIYDTYTKDVNVNSRSTGTTTFNVNFRSPKLSRGNFGTWATDMADTSPWERAWYQAKVIPLIGEEGVAESYDGHPRLVKTFFEFKNAAVSPRQGSNRDLYSYEVTVYGSYGDNITLQVRPSAGEPWIDLGVQEYTTPGLSQTLRWRNNTLPFDFNAAGFRFRGVRESKVFEGPFWPVSVGFMNSSVSPARGLSSTPFAYSIEVNATKNIEVGLNVWDLTSKSYVMAGKKSYTSPPETQKLIWTGIQQSESGAEGASNYYFTFHYPGSELPFLTTNDRLKRYYPGPDVTLVELSNATVSPANGSLMIPYTYCVEIGTALPRADVELQTSDPGSSIWNSRGVQTYDGSDKTLCWSGVRIDGDADGRARYRFICRDSVSEIYTGPRIGSMAITASVEPNNGTLYFTQALEGAISRVYMFHYRAEIDQLDVKDRSDVQLEVYDPVARSWYFGGSQTYEPGKRLLNYSVNFAKIPFRGPFLGETRYRFLSNDRVLGEFKGPYIDVNIRNESAVEVPTRAGTKITYRAEVRSSLKSIPVALAYTTDNVNWKLSDTRTYESKSQEWKVLEWASYPRFYASEYEVLRGAK